jgi:hypothetical protein
MGPKPFYGQRSVNQQRSIGGNRPAEDTACVNGNVPTNNLFNNSNSSGKKLCHICASPQHLAAQCPMKRTNQGQGQGQNQSPENNANNRFNRSPFVNLTQNVNAANGVESSPETAVKQVTVTSPSDSTSSINQTAWGESI